MKVSEMSEQTYGTIYQGLMCRREWLEEAIRQCDYSSDIVSYYGDQLNLVDLALEEWRRGFKG